MTEKDLIDRNLTKRMDYKDWYKIKLWSLLCLLLCVGAFGLYACFTDDIMPFLFSVFAFVGGTIPLQITDMWFMNKGEA